MLFNCRLDLDKWINDPPSDSSDEDMTSSSFFPNSGMNDDFRSSYNNEEKHKTYEPTEEELEIVSHCSKVGSIYRAKFAQGQIQILPT